MDHIQGLGNNWNLRQLYDDENLEQTFSILCNPNDLLLNLLVKPDPNRKHRDFHLPISQEAARIMQIYGYD